MAEDCGYRYWTAVRTYIAKWRVGKINRTWSVFWPPWQRGLRGCWWNRCWLRRRCWWSHPCCRLPVACTGTERRNRNKKRQIQEGTIFAFGGEGRWRALPYCIDRSRSVPMQGTSISWDHSPSPRNYSTGFNPVLQPNLSTYLQVNLPTLKSEFCQRPLLHLPFTPPKNNPIVWLARTFVTHCLTSTTSSPSALCSMLFSRAFTWWLMMGNIWKGGGVRTKCKTKPRPSFVPLPN